MSDRPGPLVTIAARGEAPGTRPPPIPFPRRLAGLAPMAAAFAGLIVIAYFVLRPQGDGVPLSVAAAIPGHQVPDFTLRDIDGAPRALRALRGRAVLLNFWGTYCLPCRHEMPEIQRTVAHFRGRPVTIWGIEDQGNTAGLIRLFIDQIGVSYPQLPDERAAVGLRYRVNALPVSVFIGSDGRVTATNVGALTYPDFVARLGRGLGGT